MKPKKRTRSTRLLDFEKSAISTRLLRRGDDASRAHDTPDGLKVYDEGEEVVGTQVEASDNEGYSQPCATIPTPPIALKRIKSSIYRWLCDVDE
ncbi:hypothetical protein L3X38_018481 [Prunus dulcis]|uniref:Uncharacterized protein n=1 Tax=Prunus dulcis TaxID=3755 RepID=A0AAD4W9B2_PRUDU|nr:hypothetical protein L3X38_018481 [Prunus dulcis]